jgi:hypothetical protein
MLKTLDASRRNHRHVDHHPEVIAGCADKTTGHSGEPE